MAYLLLTEIFLLDLLAEYCQWLSQTGYTERAFSIWQALVEFVCFCPPHLESRRSDASTDHRAEFQLFWKAKDRGVLFGIPGAKGWATWYAGERRMHQKRKKAVTMITSNSNVLLRELEEDWCLSSSTASVNWDRIAKNWNGTSP